MGLDIMAKGMNNISFSYHGYFLLRCMIIEKMYGSKCVEIFRKDNADADEIAIWNGVCNNDLDLFLLHCDCDGKFTPKECRKVYAALEPIQLENEDANQMLERLKMAFKHCAKNRVTMYYR